MCENPKKAAHIIEQQFCRLRRRNVKILGRVPPAGTGSFIPTGPAASRLPQA